MINISTTFSFSIIYTSLFPISLTSKYSFILHFRNFEYSLQTSKTASISLFYVKSSNFIFFFSKKLQYTKRRKKRRRKREENMKKKKRRRQKERRKEKEEKKEEKNKESEMKEKYGKIIFSYLYQSIPFHSYHVSIHFTTPHHLYQILFYPFLSSSSTSFGRIIKHQWYLSLYIISNLFTC